MKLLIPCALLCLSALVFTTASGADAAVKAPAAGEYAGSWQSSGNAGGKLRLKLKQEGAVWSAEASFTYQEADVPTTMKTIKVEGAKVEFVFEWKIQDAAGESKLTGEVSEGKLTGTYESKSSSGVSNGTWTVTRT